MVGLPARGKTYISYKVSRYLAWLGVNCRVFNVGEYRRKLVGAQLDHSFFDPHNPVAIEQRLKCAVLALNDMFAWFEDVHNGVAIYDATNSTRSRRQMISDECRKHNVEVMFCESWCDDANLVDMNILEVKRTSPDYKGVKDPQKVLDDFRHRIDHYSEVYEPVGGDGKRPLAKNKYPYPPEDPTLEQYDERLSSYVRKINVGSQVVINRVTSYLESRIVYFLMNIHIATRSVLFSRHGESMYNLNQRLGGDPDLSPNGRKYADALPSLISKLLGNQPLTVWTSTLRRTHQTAAGLPYKKMQWKALDELDAGVCEGLTYEDVEREYPEEYEMRDQNKFEFRYRGGESYRDVVLRLEPVIMELERQQNIMVISHQAVLRCIYAYFLDIGPDELPYLKIPLHTVMKLTWTAYGCDIQTYKIDIDAVDTHRAKPKGLKRGGTVKAGSTSSAAATARSSASAAPESVAGSPATKTDASRFPTHDQLLSSSAMVVPAREEQPDAPAAPKAPASSKLVNAVSDTWDVDEVWTPVDSPTPKLPFPTPASTNAPPSVAQGSIPRDEEIIDTGAVRAAVESVVAKTTASQQMQAGSHPHIPVLDEIIKGEQSSLSVSGGHDQGGHDSHIGHVWPSQISPSMTRENSRSVQLSITTTPHVRSDPRNGSPVHLSPSAYAASFSCHDHVRDAGVPLPGEDTFTLGDSALATEDFGSSTAYETDNVISPEAASRAVAIPAAMGRNVMTPDPKLGMSSTPSMGYLKGQSMGGTSPTVSEGGRPSSHRQPLLGNLKIDELHIAGHGNVDVVETTPTITLRYSSNVPAEVQKQTVALKNELVGIEDDDSSSSAESVASSSGDDGDKSVTAVEGSVN
ncbi:Fructose-2,6-bisphosphatase [Linderina macrospora]|uniref:Fructose-2,6-bisphosphatase n=1 Tax=Linderina macrospora TaxID=4868 RepID=A0ACC1JG27_9FUNG|nr:Fructose-2,6-bisphosphatase [Linderina macrospora]